MKPKRSEITSTRGFDNKILILFKKSPLINLSSNCSLAIKIMTTVCRETCPRQQTAPWAHSKETRLKTRGRHLQILSPSVIFVATVHEVMEVWPSAEFLLPNLLLSPKAWTLNPNMQLSNAWFMFTWISRVGHFKFGTMFRKKNNTLLQKAAMLFSLE